MVAWLQYLQYEYFSWLCGYNIYNINIFHGCVVTILTIFTCFMVVLLQYLHSGQLCDWVQTDQPFWLQVPAEVEESEKIKEEGDCSPLACPHQ